MAKSPPSFASVKKGYGNLWAKATIRDAKAAEANEAADYIIKHRARYEKVAERIGAKEVWPLIGAIHWREASGNFEGILHNGQKIIGTGRKTTLEPKNRGPFSSWEEAAVDALVLKGWHRITDWYLIDRGLYDRVITVPMAIGGTWAVEWKNTAIKPWLGLRIKNVACMVQSYGLAPTHVVWMQGESDTSSANTQALYTAQLQAVIDNIRGAGITAPILVNVESWLNGATYAPVRNAQMSVAGTNGVIQGANIDSLNNSYRYDGTHLNANGAVAVANMLADIIAANQ